MTIVEAVYLKKECIQKWKLNELGKVVAQIEDDLACTISNGQIEATQNYTNIVLHIAGKALISMREILQLSAHGFPDGAIHIARTLYEHAIILTLFENRLKDSGFDSLVENYYVDSEIQRIKTLKYESSCCRKNEIETEKLTEELEELKKSNNIKGRYWWAGCNSFFDVAKNVIESLKDDREQRFFHIMHSAYKVACIYTHSNCLGSISRLGQKPELGTIDVSASINGHAIPLFLSTSALIQIMGITYKTLGIDYENIRRILNNLTFFYNEVY